MPVTVVVGGQFGSEGKGKVAHLLAARLGVEVAVRVGGSNSGHTVINEAGERFVLRHLPTPALLPHVVSVLPPGCYIDVPVLLEEVRRLGLEPDRLVIDPKATVVGPDEKSSEAASTLRERIGSTQSGTGAALARRVARDGSVTLAQDVPDLQRFVRHTLPLLRATLKGGRRVLIEGTQGYGLSVLHSPHYPYATSRETTAAGALAESGLSPLDVDQVVLVVRAFPIRVAGNSGPLANELTWDAVRKLGHHDHDLTEYTSVTGGIRRVAAFDPSIVQAAIAANAPTTVVMNHLDYVDHSACEAGHLTPAIAEFVSRVEDSIGRNLDLIGVGARLLAPGRVREPRFVQAIG